jgi:hypothetical protein
MFELAVTVNLACADCGKTSVGDGFVNTDVPDLFEQGRGEALLQVECPIAANGIHALSKKQTLMHFVKSIVIKDKK